MFAEAKPALSRKVRVGLCLGRGAIAPVKYEGLEKYPKFSLRLLANPTTDGDLVGF